MYSRHAAGLDVVAPSVQGLQGMTPSTIGIAANARFGANSNKGGSRRAGPGNTSGGEKFQTRYARIADMMLTVTKGLDALIKIRDSAEAQEDPELSALASDPRVMAAFNKVIEAIGKAANELISRAGSASQQDEQQPPEADTLAPSNRPNIPGMDSALGSISNPMILDARRLELARKHAAQMLSTAEYGTAGDKVRAKFGQEPRELDADELYARFEGKK